VNWDAVGAIAELIGALGVVASLAYLAVQIRQNTQHIDFNTRAIRASTFQSFSDTFGDFEDLLLANLDLGKVWVHGLTDFDSLDMGDRVTFNNVAHKFLRIYETLFLQYEAGLVERSLFDNAHRFSDQMLEYPGLRSYWTHNRRRFSERFGAYLDDRIGQSSLPRALSRAAEGSH
jgi:hypothetical protein